MNLFKRLFGSNLTKSKKSPNEFMVNLSSVAKNQTTTNETIVEELKYSRFSGQPNK